MFGRRRKPRGTPAGGQFAPSAHPRPGIELDYDGYPAHRNEPPDLDYGDEPTDDELAKMDADYGGYAEEIAKMDAGD